MVRYEYPSNTYSYTGSEGTYTRPAGCIALTVLLIGGGGGGGGGSQSDGFWGAKYTHAGGGGGSGALLQVTINDPVGAYYYYVGNGGSGGSGGYANLNQAWGSAGSTAESTYFMYISNYHNFLAGGGSGGGGSASDHASGSNYDGSGGGGGTTSYVAGSGSNVSIDKNFYGNSGSGRTAGTTPDSSSSLGGNGGTGGASGNNAGSGGQPGYLKVTATIAYYTYTASTNDANKGTLSGSGEYKHGNTVTTVATPATGYHLASWSDGSTTGIGSTTAVTRTFTIGSDVSLTATFAPNSYTITVKTTSGGGTVTGGGIYDYGTTITITAMPNKYYRFLTWSDGNTSTSHTITVTGNKTYIGTFVDYLPIVPVKVDGAWTNGTVWVSVPLNQNLNNTLAGSTNNSLASLTNSTMGATWVKAEKIYVKVNGSWVLINMS